METPAPLPRSIRLLRPPAGANYGIFAVKLGEETAFYVFREIPCFIGGRGFVVYRLGRRRAYHVRVGKRENCSCECLGYLYRQRCRHVSGLLTLIRRRQM
jgi:hypothetical protein